MTNIIHNVTDRLRDWVGSWRIEPLDFAKLTKADVGRTVIYHNHIAEAGVITSYGNGLVFVRYTARGTSQATRPEDLVYGIGRADDHPDAPKE
jgi:hypothetical protein